MINIKKIINEEFLFEQIKSNIVYHKIIEFINLHTTFNDIELHKADFLKKSGIPDQLFNKIVLNILISFLNRGLYYTKNIDESTFHKNQIMKGIQVEFEHTDNTYIAKRITLDHLTEHEYYYDVLINAGL